MFKRISGLTLIELLISIVLLSIIVMGFSNIDLFIQNNVISATRRSQLQNEVSFVLNHMEKHITGGSTIGSGGAIGTVTQPPIANALPNAIAGDNSIIVTVDSNNNGQRDGPGVDNQIAYRYRPASHEIWYYPVYVNPASAHETLAQGRIMPDFGNVAGAANSYAQYNPLAVPLNNWIEVQITACWDPAAVVAPCGDPRNPSVTMRSRIKMPSVSTN